MVFGELPVELEARVLALEARTLVIEARQARQEAVVMEVQGGQRVADKELTAKVSGIRGDIANLRIQLSEIKELVEAQAEPVKDE